MKETMDETPPASLGATGLDLRRPASLLGHSIEYIGYS